MDAFESHKSALSSLNLSFLSRTLARRGKSSKASEGVKGPWGLNTLYIPEDTIVADLVFVHGLGGGSRSTWTKYGEPSLYWPEKWLPNDIGFRDVRIHSFGYDSNWQKESSLNIHDFSKSLLGSIHDCPAIPRASDVCASMPRQISRPNTALASSERRDWGAIQVTQSNVCEYFPFSAQVA